MTVENAEKRKPSLLTGAPGAQVLSLLLPCLLMWWTNAGGLPIFSGDNWNLGDLLLLGITAIILCGPGTFILAMILVAILRRESSHTGEARKRLLVRAGTAGGFLMAFLNVPAYLGFLHVGNLSFLPILAIGGGMAGGWLGWRVYAKLEPPQPYWPRFSLGTLLLLVLVWAMLFFIYAPKEL